MDSSLHYFSYCYPLPVIDTFSGIMLAQQIVFLILFGKGETNLSAF